MSDHPSDAAKISGERAWFERVWTHREENLYPSLFGPESVGIYTLTSEILLNTFKQETFDPRWLHYGVFRFAPTPTRQSWLYVTSGMSNDWESEQPNPSSISGLGCEFILETAMECEWAILRLLHLMAFQILLAHNRYPGRAMMTPYDRIPLNAPIVGDSKLTWLLMVPPINVPSSVQLESGSFQFFHFVALTETEAAFAREMGGDKLLEKLNEQDACPVIVPTRDGILLD